MVVLKLLREFAGGTSLHGCRFLVSPKTSPRTKIIWAILLVIGLFSASITMDYSSFSVSSKYHYTAIPYRASTGPEQGFPCVVFPHRGKPVFNTGFPGDENRFFPVGNTTQGKPSFRYRDGFAVYNKT